MQLLLSSHSFIFIPVKDINAFNGKVFLVNLIVTISDLFTALGFVLQFYNLSLNL